MKCLVLFLVFTTLSLPTKAQFTSAEDDSMIENSAWGPEQNFQQEQESVNPSFDVPSLNEYGNPDAPVDDEFDSTDFMDEELGE